jgi:hypothetical protein
MSVGDIEEWYRTRFPTIPLGSLVPARCYHCWQELNPGDRVVLRLHVAANGTVQTNDKGPLREILKSDEGSLFVVDLDSGKDVVLIRAELRKVRDNEE